MAKASTKLHVTAVLVSFNRKELLGEALAALSKQSVRPDRLIVVDNASTDGAAEAAADAIAVWGDAGRLIALEENTGGAGGFAVGIAAALLPAKDKARTDWIWVMDDDTVPHHTALEEALAAHTRFTADGPDTLAVMGSRVVWTDGADHPMNTPKAKIGASAVERERAAAAEVMEIRSISFVSAFLRADRVREIGLPIADYFLWNDDFEFSARMLNGARGIFVPQSVVTHKTKKAGSSDADPGERFFFEVRNKMWVFRLSRALKTWERAAYRAASLRRWTRTIKGSSNPRLLLDCLQRGMRDGLGKAPRTNAQVLAGAGVPADVQQIIAELDPQTLARRGSEAGR